MKRPYTQIIDQIDNKATEKNSIEPVTRVLRSQRSIITCSKVPVPLNKIKNSTIISTSNQERIFKSCLKLLPLQLPGRESIKSPTTRNTTSFLLKCLNNSELGDDNWLSSQFIDYVISKFARVYYNFTYFMSIDFVVLGLSSIDPHLVDLRDLSGRKIDYKDTRKSIVFVCNSQNIHWNLVRVIRKRGQERLELFEPMGKPSSRGLSYRQVSKRVIEWLDVCCPLQGGKSWLSVGYSAITKQQQFTNFDCGVACLLYAEKCGQEQTKEDINNFTTQDNITEYRRTLQTFNNTMNGLLID